MNKILTKEVSFPLAKLLAEKGFKNNAINYLNRNYYNHLGVYNGDVTDYIKAFVDKKDTTQFKNIDAPTISEVLDYIYYNYNIWISVKRDYDNGILLGYESITEYEDGDVYGETFSSQLEAYEDAINQVINH